MARTKQTARASTGWIAPRTTPIHLAASSGKAEILRLLLKKGRADLRKRDGLGRTPVHHAVANGHVDAVKILVAHGALLSTRDEEGITPLALAAASGNLRIFKLLLRKGASTSSVCRGGRTILHYACTGGDPATVRAVLDNGASISAKDRMRNTAIDLAVRLKSWDIVKVLLDEGCRLSALSQPQHEEVPPTPADAGNDALITALREGLEEGPCTRKAVEAAARLGLVGPLVRLIEQHGCDGDAASSWGESPIACATENGHSECVSILLSHGADVNGTKSSRGRRVSALWAALVNKHDNIAAILLDAGASPLVGHENSRSSIIQALVERGPIVAAQLLAHIPDVSQLSRWIILLAEGKHIDVLSEYYRAIAPDVHGKYSLKGRASRITKLVFMLSATAASPASGRPRTRSITAECYSDEDRRRTITAALDDMFVAVSFLLAAVDLEALKEIFADTPRFVRKAHQLLPSLLDGETDIQLVSRLAEAGYTHPPPPLPQTPRPQSIPTTFVAHAPSSSRSGGSVRRSITGRPDPPPLTPEQVKFMGYCEAGNTSKVRDYLQTHGSTIVNIAGIRHRTPLHVAAHGGHLDIVKLLVENSADLKATTFFGTSPEELAERYNKQDVQAFLKTAKWKRAREASG